MGTLAGKITAAIAIISLAVNLWLYRTLQAERVERTRPAAAAVLPANPAAEPVVAATSAAVAAMPSKSMSPQAATTAAAGPAADTKKSPEECLRLVREAELQRYRDPAQREVLRNQQVTQLNWRDPAGDAARELGLTDEQMQRLYQVQANANLSRSERRIANPSEVYEPQPGAPDDLEASTVAAEFGSQVADRWIELQRVYARRVASQQYVSAFALADVPLSAEQRTRMGDAVMDLNQAATRASYAEAQQSRQQAPRNGAEMADRLEQEEEGQSRFTAQLLERAGAFLSQSQQGVLRQTRARMNAAMRTTIQSMRANPSLYASAKSRIPGC